MTSMYVFGVWIATALRAVTGAAVLAMSGLKQQDQEQVVAVSIERFALGPCET